MSIAGQCPGCAIGDHSRHDVRFGLMEGVIGGTYCDCGGDCAEAFARSVRDWAALLPKPQVES